MDSHSCQCLLLATLTQLKSYQNSFIFSRLSQFLYLPHFFNSSTRLFQLTHGKVKKMCLNETQLQKSKIFEGIAFPNFHFYYWAANLWCLVFWSFYYGKLNCPDWVTMELHVNDDSSRLAFLGFPLPLSSIKSLQNPVVQHSMRIWAQFSSVQFTFKSYNV